MINHTLRRSLSLLLTLFILFSGIPATVLAEDPSEPETEVTEESSEPTTEATEGPSKPTTEATEEPSEPTTEATEESAEPTTEATEESAEPKTEPTEITEGTQPPTEPAVEPTQPAILRIIPAEDDPEPKGPGLYFGRLHAHSDPVSGVDSITELFQQAARTDNMDFFAITDHSDSFDHTASGSLTDGSASLYWTAGKAAAETVTGRDFVGIFGFEMSWPERMQTGHISTFCTSGFLSWDQPPYDRQESALESYYESLSSVTGAVGQWNHPGNQYGTFSDFDHYSPGADRVMQLLEVAGAPDLAAPSGYRDGYGYYSLALDKGWHVAPTNNTDSGRTVILAQELTEEGLWEAVRSHRVYATEDPDLEIRYSMNGSPMGSILKKRHLGDRATITAELYDPSDSAIGTVEIIVDGGTVAARQMIEDNSDALQFAVSPEFRYYYLRITQPDGDIAVTAPVWIETSENLGISDLTCETPVPVQNEDVSLVLEFYNRETADLLVDSIQMLADGIPIAEDTALTRIPAGETASHGLTFRHNGIGQTTITVILAGTLEGAAREYEKSIPLSFRQSRQVTDLVIDGSHGNVGLTDLGTLKTMAAAENIRVTVADSGISAEMLKNCRFLLVTCPSLPFSDAFLDTVAEYIGCGGSVLLCGQAGDPGNEELNRLLESVGYTMRLNSDTLTDPIYNGGTEVLLFSDAIDRESIWCVGITDAQVYRCSNGCSVAPGQGDVLISAGAAAVLCCEETEAGGTILAAGNLLSGNEELKEPANLWDAPFANRTITENLLGIGGETLPLSTIRQAREAEAGTVLRVRGYVTAGTANRWNRFPRTLYIQDDTGGIGIIPFDTEGIAVGTPVEITGAAETLDGNRILKPVFHKLPDATFYRYLPKTGSWKDILDTDFHGGELVEVEGECTEVVLSEDNVVSDILLKDGKGNTAHVHIEDYIFSGATGKNTLHEDIKKGRTVRAMGILHKDENGDAVIRVRNCEEVVYVPPRKVYINPKTGDWLTSVTNEKRRGNFRGVLYYAKGISNSSPRGAPFLQYRARRLAISGNFSSAPW